MLGTVTLTPAAQAHEGTDPTVAAVLDRIAPDMPGVTIEVETTRLGPQFVLENPTPTEVTILSSVGDPLFRIGPQGVLGNFRSPEWYTSKTPDGAIAIPERAAEQGPPVWAQVSKEPSWGWFDHRLHSVKVAPDQKDRTAPLSTIGTWTVPLEYGDALGSVDGHFEYRPAVGTFAPSLEETRPAPGVTLTALQGNPTPGIAITNEGRSEVVVLGDAGEPYLRMTAAGGTEANQASPTWIASLDPAARGELAGDAAAPPQWQVVQPAAQYSFVLDRAAPDQALTELYAITDETVVRNWTLSLVVDGQRRDVAGTTTMTPLGYQPSSVGWWLLGAGIVLAAGAGRGGRVVRPQAPRRGRPTPTPTRPTGKKEKVTSPT